MGTAANQITTFGDLNLKQKSFITGSHGDYYNCPTKSEITSSDLFKVNETVSSTTNVTTNWSYNNEYVIPPESVEVTRMNSVNSVKDFQACSLGSSSTFAFQWHSTSTLYCGTGSSTQQYEFFYNNTIVDVEMSLAAAKRYAVCKKSTTISGASGCAFKFKANIYITAGLSATNLPTSVYNSFGQYNYTGRFLLCIDYGSTHEIVDVHEPSAGGGFESTMFYPKSNSFTLYLIPVYIGYDGTTSEFSNDKYAGFGFTISSASLSKYTTYYESNQCVKYSDVEIDTNKEFLIYFGIWNAKTATEAKMSGGYVKALISTSSSATSSTATWHEIGRYKITSNIGKNSALTGLIRCKIPESLKNSLGTQYYLKVQAGDTNLNQTWQYAYGSSASIKSIGAWTTAPKTDSTYSYTPTTPFQPNANSDTTYCILNNFGYDVAPYYIQVRGRTQYNAFLFKIT